MTLTGSIKQCTGYSKVISEEAGICCGLSIRSSPYDFSMSLTLATLLTSRTNTIHP